jgi:hypothetical protein
MSRDIPPGQPAERRSELRKNKAPLRSAELKLPSLPIYLFKVKDSSQNGFCLLVKEDSNILEHIQVGQILNIRSYSEDKMEPSDFFLSEIKHITKKDEGPYAGHELVGFMILEKQNQTWS